MIQRTTNTPPMATIKPEFIRSLDRYNDAANLLHAIIVEALNNDLFRNPRIASQIRIRAKAFELAAIGVVEADHG